MRSSKDGAQRPVRVNGITHKDLTITDEYLSKIKGEVKREVKSEKR